jgi:hypothetical protein
MNVCPGAKRIEDGLIEISTGWTVTVAVVVTEASREQVAIT